MSSRKNTPGLDVTHGNAADRRENSKQEVSATATKTASTKAAPNASRFDKLLRRFVPSTARLSYNPLFKFVGYGVDFCMRRLFPEFADLPPNHLRVRVGVLNRIFFNHVHCIKSGYNFWLNAFAHGLCSFESNIVEIGCGYGRKAKHLKNYSMQGVTFAGQYTGIDIDPELLAYARRAFPSPQFTFLQTSHQSKTYSKEGTANDSTGASYSLDVASDSQDFVFSTSLFTHLLEKELVNYIEESFRVLKPGGYMQMNFYCLDFMKANNFLGERWSFKHQVGAAFVESLKYPEAAVAYTTEYVTGVCRSAGFSRIEVICDQSGRMRQSFIRGQK